MAQWANILKMRSIGPSRILSTAISFALPLGNGVYHVQSPWASFEAFIRRSHVDPGLQDRRLYGQLHEARQ
ncbi:hypothetical protein LZ32DRAFT_571851 [Colletotrichum eremochloae]|nr:hypothetical protein LZ32DRAFT_571851 [Colletotrichum eremochloae]